MPNTTPHIRSLARSYGEDAIRALGNIMLKSKNERNVLTAAGMLLDRGYGRTHEDIEGREAITITIRKIFDRDLQQQPLTIDHQANGNGKG